MAKYVPMDLLQSLHGKVCGHSDVYFAERNGTRYTGKICNPRTSAPTEGEIAAREKFGSVSGKVKTAMASPTEAAKYTAAFRKQNRYKTLRGYVFSLLYAQGA